MITLILGESGSGKTASIENLDDKETFIINAIDKPLSFRKRFKSAVAGDLDTLKKWLECAIKKNEKQIMVIDDFQYFLIQKILADNTDKNKYSKYEDLAKSVWDILTMCSKSPIRFYFLSHTDKDENGFICMKTVGKMLKEKISLEGFFSTVLRAQKDFNGYFFSTQNNGGDTVKSPRGMFEAERIDNDLALVDNAIVNYYRED